MRQRLKAFTLIELLVVIAIIALLISILLPSLSRARELSKRLVCASNIKGIGTSAKIYANDYNERWMIPPFLAANIGDPGIDYVNNSQDTDDWEFGGTTLDAGSVGSDRERQSTSSTRVNPGQGSTTVSVTRAYWMMVRSGDITVKQFICPSSGDQEDETENLDLYFDFTGYDHISYAYQVPFGPRDTRPREGMDNRQIVAADKGPYYIDEGNVLFQNDAEQPITLDDSPREWKPFNSANHGGRNNGEGQNCLYADGHALFQKKPAVGIDNDNIYTVMENVWGDINSNRIHGLTVFESGAQWPYPGQDAFGNCVTCFASTDTLLYP